MKIVRKIFKTVLVLLLSLLVLVAVADAAWIYVPQLTAHDKIEGLADVAHSPENISTSTQSRVIALGEATHGNVEFQQLKLTVLRQLVETEGVQAFALEADFGEGMEINDYIHGKGDIATAEAAVQTLSFNIYHTQQMTELIQWMHDYNMTPGQDKPLSFYGFDLQNPKTGLRRLLRYCEENSVLPELDKAPLQAYVDGGYSIIQQEAQGALQCLSAIEQELLARGESYSAGADDYALMLRIIKCAQNLSLCLENGGAANYIYYNNARDGFMADNVLWISEYSQAQGCEKLLIAGHNGHVAYQQQFYTTMGSHLRDALGSDYFVIGTDYYKTDCNINVVGPDASRADHRFCSADVFAANAKAQGGSYYLNFSDVLAQDGAAAELINKEIYMGSLGEGYTWTMHLLPLSQRIKNKPVELYDAMVFFYQTTPIEVFCCEK